jgi:hypothetical protein
MQLSLLQNLFDQSQTIRREGDAEVVAQYQKGKERKHGFKSSKQGTWLMARYFKTSRSSSFGILADVMHAYSFRWSLLR